MPTSHRHLCHRRPPGGRRPGRPGRGPPTRPTSTRWSPRSRWATPAQFVAAARAARAAQPAWADVPAPVRGRAIAHIGRLVEENAEALARLVTREIGKPYAEALGEVQEIIDTCDFFLGEGRRLYGQTVPSEMPDKQLFTFRNPVGVVAVITAGNFPVAVPSWYLVPALLCGNAVVWKPAEYSAAAAVRLPRAVLPRRRAARRGAQRGARRTARRPSPGWSRRSTPGLIDKVGFTGSSEVGAQDRRAHRPAPAVGLPRAGRQEPDGRRRRTPTSTSRSRERCSPGSAPPGSGAPRSAR